MPEGGLKLVVEAADDAALDRRLGLSVSPSVRTSPATAVALGMLAFAFVWLAHLNYASLVPPTDDLEQLTWSRSLEWGYYKHPPLPTWLLWPALRVFGWSAWTVYLAGAATTLAAFWIFWRLLVRLRGESYALVALLAAACISYYNGRLYYYNHNVVLLVANAACAALTWQAFATQRLRWWVALGLAVGLGALAKYQVAVTAASILVFATHQRAWQHRTHRRGIVLAALVAGLLFAPHLAWLRTHGFAPLHYAVESSLGANLGPLARIVDTLNWLLDQLLNRALPAWLLLGLAAWLARRAPAAGEFPMRQGTQGSAARALLLSWGAVPLLFMPIVGLFAGADLQKHWGTPFLHFAVPAVLELAPRRWRLPASRAPLLTAFVAVQGLLLVSSHLTSPLGPQAMRDSHWRHFDARRAARAIGDAARDQLGGPIRVVSGPAAIAGALALEWPESPLVLIDGRLDRSPWIDESLLRACGWVQLIDAGAPQAATPVGSALPGWRWLVVPPEGAVATSTCRPVSRR